MHSVAEMSKKLDDLKSCSERTNVGNQRGIDQTGLNRNYRQTNNNNNLAMSSKGTEMARQGGRAPVIERTSKPEPPCFNCGKKDHVWSRSSIPFMTEILDKLSVVPYILTIDLNKAYSQIPLSEESKSKTAFIISGKGLYQYRRMPFGLTGAPEIFQRLMDEVITSDIRPYVFACLNDVIFVTENFQDHLHWLEKTTNRLTEAGLILSPDKCHFCRSKVKYFGFKINQDGLVVDDEKVRPILEYPRPRNLRNSRRFIGATSWY